MGNGREILRKVLFIFLLFRFKKKKNYNFRPFYYLTRPPVINEGAFGAKEMAISDLKMHINLKTFKRHSFDSSH
jgi:hypothetical protein